MPVTLKPGGTVSIGSECFYKEIFSGFFNFVESA